MSAIPAIRPRSCIARLTCLVGALALSCVLAASAQSQSTSASSAIVLTPTGTIRVAEGELHLFVGDRAAVQPQFYRPAPSGAVEYSVTGGEYQYRVSVAQIEIDAPGGSFSAAVIGVTAAEIAATQKPAVVWCAWRPSLAGGAPFEGVVIASPGVETAVSEAKPPWNPAWTWFFDGEAFAREEGVVYYVTGAVDWEQQTWVRLPDLPYPELTPESNLGYIRFAQKPKPRQTASFRLVVPVKPLPVEIWRKIRPPAP
ncbi:MAG: hypothetical protein GC154_14690 [bacterium]|nr:hypothetical protein [bacterium]